MNGNESVKFKDFWLRDLEAALAESHARPIPGMADAPSWMMGWAGSSFLLLLLLPLFGGYHAGFHAINGIAPDLPSRYWEWLTVLGDGRIAFAIALMFVRRRPEIFWALVLAGICGLLYTHSLKPWFGMLRPPAALEEGAFHIIGPAHQHSSFPSGHSLTATTLLGVWLWFLRDWRLRLALIVFASAIAMSRVVVGVHWPVDVAGGILGGCLAAWAGVRLSLLWRGGLTIRGHLICLSLCIVYAFFLFLDDGGYHQAANFQILVALAGYLIVFHDYYLAPCRRWKDANGVTEPESQPVPKHVCMEKQGSTYIPWVLSVCFLLQLLFLSWPEIDPWVSGWFYREGVGFFLGGNGLVQFSYRLFARVHFLVAGILVLLLIWAFFCRKRGRQILYLLLVLLIGPGLLVNGVVKAESGRARPHQTDLFGGEKMFTPAFEHADQCNRNCSFVCGHCAMGFYPLALAWVFRRRRWLVAGMALGGLVGLGRIVQGGHFLSDVVFAFWLVYFTALLLAWLFFGTTRIKAVPD